MAKRDADGDFDVSPRKTMAAGGGMPNSTFGVEQGGSGGVGVVEHMDRARDTGKHSGDGERGAGKPVKHTRGKMRGQAAPDHGPHKTGR